MADTTCGRCGKFSHMTSIGIPTVEQAIERPIHRIECTFRCDRCKRLNLGGLETSSLPMNMHMDNYVTAFWESEQPSYWLPAYVEGQDYPDVPEHVAKPASEAHSCHSISADMSAILMARSVIEAVAKDQGIKSGSLFNKIDGLRDKGLINDFAKTTAHTIRTFGNDMAHGDFTVEVDSADAAGVLTFMDYILREVYQAPAELQRLQNAATARKVGPGVVPAAVVI